MKRKLSKLIFACAFAGMLSLPQTMVHAQDDITGKALEKDMRAMIDAGVLRGYGDGIYRPDEEVTRGQFATFISRALNLPKAEPAFSDVGPSSPLAEGIYSASAAGIVKGISPTQFAPDKPISRQEAAAMVDRSFQYKKIDRGTATLDFTDAGLISNSFKQAVALNARDGIIQGFANGDGSYRFGPNETATRQQSAAFINRMLNKIGGSGEPVPPPPVVEKGPVLQVKLQYYLGNKKEIDIVPRVDYSMNLPNVNLTENQAYKLSVSGTNIAIFNGDRKIGETAELAITPRQGKGPIAINGREYLGTFKFIVDKGYIRPINSIGMEDYLKGVVPREMPASWHKEALKAQAVTARTYAYGKTGGVIDDTESNQVYGGYLWDDRTTEAVEATEGQVLAYGGKPIGAGAVFSSSNGGFIESNSNEWGSAQLPYLKAKKDPYDPVNPWNISFKKQQIDVTSLDLNRANSWWGAVKEAEQTDEILNMKKWLQVNRYPGKEIKIAAIPEFSLHSKTTGQRMKRGNITFEVLVRENETALLERVVLADIPASRIRAIVGTNKMKSTLVTTLDVSGDTIKAAGAGYGHGVGMSQYGAYNAAKQGKTYREILSFYFENTSLTTIY